MISIDEKNANKNKSILHISTSAASSVFFFGLPLLQFLPDHNVAGICLQLAWNSIWLQFKSAIESSCSLMLLTTTIVASLSN